MCEAIDQLGQHPDSMFSFWISLQAPLTSQILFVENIHEMVVKSRYQSALSIEPTVKAI